MAINIRMQSQSTRLKPKITVIGVGGAGGNAVNNMIFSGLEGCEFLVCNTDAQALEGNSSPHKIQMGVNITRGLGAGANPEIGRAAAEESIEEILAYLEGSNMVFVTCGMGGGTGTGAAPVIAQAAREAGILTVGVITKPFSFEGTHRMKLAENGIAELQRHVDTLIVIPNQNLFRIANEKTTFADAFKMADEVLQSGVRGVTDLMVMPGDINLDFADIRAVMAEMGKAMMGTGEAEGERRAIDAAEKAISNPLLDDVSLKGAKGVLINIMGSRNDITLFEVDEAANRVREEVDPDANIIFGSTFDDTLQGRIRVSVVATGIDAASSGARPLNLASGNVEPARRPGAPVQPRGNAGNYGGQPGYTAYERPVARTQGDNGFGGGIPASILPAQASRQHLPQASAPVQAASAQRLNTPVAQAPVYSAPQAPAYVAQQAQAPVTAAADGWDRSPEPQVQAGHASAAYAPAATAAATARKLDDQMDETQTWTRPTTPAVTQNYPQRNVTAPATAAQPKAERHGGSFIPPKPVDPRGNAVAGSAAATAAGADLFAAAPAPKADTAEKPVRKSPSLFERFTLQREKEVTAPAQAAPKMEVSPKLSVEDGGKQAEDELDIPAFLRRQAN